MWLMYKLSSWKYTDLGFSKRTDELVRFIKDLIAKTPAILQVNDCTWGQVTIYFLFETNEFVVYLRGKETPEATTIKILVELRNKSTDPHDMSQALEQCFRLATDLKNKGYTVDINNAPPQITITITIS